MASNESTIPTPATPDVCTANVLIDGAEISGEFHIQAITIAHELNRLPSACIQLADGEAAKADFAASNTAHFIPGKKIDIQLGYRSNNTSVFKGIIIKHALKIRKSGSQLMIECRDEAVKLTGGAKNHYYTDKKDSDILEEIIGRYGLAKDIAATTPDLKEVVQYEASDWDFLLCRAEANGFMVNVKDGKITVAAPVTSGNPVLKVQFGATLLEFDAEIDARWQSLSLKASTWNATDQEVTATDAKEPTPPSSGNLSADSLAAIMGDDLELRHGGKLSQPELQAWADARLLKERLARVRGRAKCQGFAGIAPGDVLELAGVGERFNGKVYVSGVRHSFAGGNWETDIQFGLNPQTVAETFQLSPPPAAGLLPAISGLQMGVVTVLESDPEGEDQIKVRLPLISASEEGIWARLATLDAGKERGTFFRPEIGDEVVVGFINDDPRHPIILGMCHSSAKPAPEPAKDDNHKKGYVSREKMKFVFDDEKKIVILETPGGNKLVLSDDGKGITLEDQNGNKIVLNDSGIQIESSKELTLKAAKDIKIEGVNIEVKAQAALKAEGGASAEVSAPNTTLKGSATTVIQGGMVQIN